MFKWFRRKKEETPTPEQLPEQPVEQSAELPEPALDVVPDVVPGVIEEEPATEPIAPESERPTEPLEPGPLTTEPSAIEPEPSDLEGVSQAEEETAPLYEAPAPAPVAEQYIEGHSAPPLVPFEDEALPPLVEEEDKRLAPPPAVEPGELLAKIELGKVEIEPVSPETQGPAEAASAAPKKGFFARLAERLTKTKTALVEKVRSAIRLHGKVDEELLEEIEMILIQSDVGVSTTQKIVGRMRTEGRKKGALEPDALLALFKSSIEEILTEGTRTLDFSPVPTIILVVGVNGTGKTTTIGKIAKQLADQGKRVVMVAADTFRAAAIEQLTIWAERTGSAIVRQDQGADPAAVVYEALEEARRDPPDVILIDTAGRLHTKINLMEELKKIVRVIRKHYPEAPHETVLVLDATTGQNAVNQVKIFHDAVQLSGLIMTKLDGTAKGGILIACKDMVNLPIFKIGIGEGAEDLRDFDPHDFVDALFSNGETK